MKFGYRSTNVFSVVASDGSLADWEITLPSMQPFPTFIFAAPEPGESPAYSDTVTGADEIWIKPGEPLKTTVTATHPVYTGIKQTAELVVANIELEPITTETNSAGLVYNPCSVPVGEGRAFRINIEAACNSIPDNDVVWQLPGGVYASSGEAAGRTVELAASTAGQHTVEVHIGDLVGFPPQISFSTHVRQTFPVRFMIVCDRDGNPIASTQQCTNWVAGANLILDQAGIELTLQSVAFTNREDWMVVDVADYTKIRGLCSSLPPATGFKVFLVGDITKSGTSGVLGFNSSWGAVVKGSASHVTFAHEIGHQLGWPDIYANPDGNWMGSVTGPTSKSRLPLDWTGLGNYYQVWLEHADLIEERLLMCGNGTSGRRDIPSGSVFGIYRYWVHGTEMFGMGAADVGLNSMDQPIKSHTAP